VALVGSGSIVGQYSTFSELSTPWMLAADGRVVLGPLLLRPAAMFRQ